MELKELVEQLNTANTELKNIKDTHTKEVKELGEAQTETKSALEASEEKMTELKAEFEAMDKKLIEMETEAKRFRGHQGGEQRKTLGAQFVESALYQDEVKQLNGFGKRFEAKDISNLTASAGALVDNYRDPNVYRGDNAGRRSLRVQDLLEVVPVSSSNSVEVMRWGTITDNASPQQPASANTAVGAGEFQAKAESDFAWELVNVPIRTMAHWVPASRQVLSDAPQLQSLIDGELTYRLQLLMDNQILNGDGTNQNFTGIFNDADINDVGQLATGLTGDDRYLAMIDHIRAAITQCQVDEYSNVNGVLLNPVNWGQLETAKATDGHYALISFAATANEPSQVWRVPVIVTNAVAEDTFLLGDWTMGAKLYMREGVSVRVSEQHANFFVENAVAVLAEQRAGLAVVNPRAFCKGSFVSGV